MNNTFITSYERDTETELDFAQARMYGNSHGRFTSPDPFGGARINPQSLNRYSYVLNNPINFIDPLGLECRDADRNGGGDSCIWVSNGQGLYDSLWNSQFTQGNDLYDNGYQVIDPATVEPFRLNTINNNEANPSNSNNLANLQGELVVLGDNGEFVLYDDEVLTIESPGEEGFSIGITGSFSGNAGLGFIGGGFQLSNSYMLYITDRGIRTQQFYTYGGALTAFGHTFGSQAEGTPVFIGASTGGSVGPTFSNATRPSQTLGTFTNSGASARFLGVDIAASPGVTAVTPSVGLGLGAGGYGNLSTNTVYGPSTPLDLVINPIFNAPR